MARRKPQRLLQLALPGTGSPIARHQDANDGCLAASYAARIECDAANAGRSSAPLGNTASECTARAFTPVVLEAVA
ncbi:hypothetical protein XdyCFBP7245_06215 [Xanthomonas dyei]|uniref:Uncharacterized protein n=1 Tax=Xanthomonas dyei TaxID=743699 RepID=A0A2S7C820_9XANT|nr:hypothetical protein XdyCFBP7245_06215 [Xanthomonas dyei]